MAGTGKDHGRMNLDIWGDDDFLDLEPDAQHLYLVLWFSPSLTYCGSGDWHPGRIAMKARGWTPAAVERAGAKLAQSAGHFLLVDTTTDEYLLRSWIKHDGLWRSPNMAVSMANARADMASRTLRGVVVHEVSKLHAREPELGSWKRDAVVKMLAQKPIDPESIDRFDPTPDPHSNPSVNPSCNPSANPSPKGYGNPSPNPPSNPGPTPAIAPLPSPLTPGGYVSTEGHQEPNPHEPPPSNCPRHPHGTTDPCRACGDARATREAWYTATSAAASKARSDEAHQRAADRADAIVDCELCDDDGYRGTAVCDHDPERLARATSRAAEIRAALAKEHTDA